jgi:DNA helicase INO80
MPGEPTPAYHRSPTQPYQHHPAPLAQHSPNLQQHRSPTSPNASELPPIKTALYSRDTSRYPYDPTSDNGDRVGHYQPQVGPYLSLHHAIHHHHHW